MEKPQGKILLGRPRHRWEDNINIDLQEKGWGAWTGLRSVEGQVTLVYAVISRRVQ